ncbi:MAG: hypothetical protein IMY77_02070 [Chloroflexi bacterium]|nr:hypothetical protein [Chloroflexota bacterium]
MPRVWKPVTAGIMSIIAGIIGIGGGAIIVLMGDFVSDSGGILGFEPLGVPTIILGIVAFTGGIFALRRRVWVMAVIGAISAIPCMPILGTLAIIFIALADQEFVSCSGVEAGGK